jgi:hypothetical protein
MRHVVANAVLRFTETVDATAPTSSVNATSRRSSGLYCAFANAPQLTVEQRQPSCECHRRHRSCFLSVAIACASSRMAAVFASSLHSLPQWSEVRERSSASARTPSAEEQCMIANHFRPARRPRSRADAACLSASTRGRGTVERREEAPARQPSNGWTLTSPEENGSRLCHAPRAADGRRFAKQISNPCSHRDAGNRIETAKRTLAETQRICRAPATLGSEVTALEIHCLSAEVNSVGRCQERQFNTCAVFMSGTMSLICRTNHM